MSTGRTPTKDRVHVHIRWMIRRDMPEVLVAEQEDQVVGFMIYELHKTKLHVLNFAVAPEWRRFGIGGQMVLKLIGKLSSHRRTKITLAVRESNLAAQLFFRSQAFKATRVLRGYYEDSGEDA